MARPARGREVLEKAQKLLAKAIKADDLRILQAVVFPLANGMSTHETAQAIGRSPRWVTRAQCLHSQRRKRESRVQKDQKQSAYDKGRGSYFLGSIFGKGTTGRDIGSQRNP